MADVSDGGELQNEPWELLDIDELFAQVPLPDHVIDARELDDALLHGYRFCCGDCESLLSRSTIRK